jgi:deoxyribodipyrimidine photo-lyase
MKRALIIFRRDLRVDDNRTLREASHYDEVIPCFILDPRQVTQQNQFLTEHGLQFMYAALHQLAEDIHAMGGRLYIYEGLPHIVLKKLLQKIEVDVVLVHKDYTPFSAERDSALAHVCTQHAIEFKQIPDVLLQEPEDVFTGSQKPYTIFTPFYKRASQLHVKEPQKIKQIKFYRRDLLPDARATIPESYSITPQTVLRNLKNFKHYQKTRDIPSIDTTHLSAHLKFGTLSIRTVYHAIFEELGHSPLLRQLYWRDFYTHLAFHFPIVFGTSYKSVFNGIEWSYSPEHFERWCHGLTGFPLVDAGMRELNATGFMHNRVRMVFGQRFISRLAFG